MKEGWMQNKLSELCDAYNGLWKGKKPPYINVGVIRNANFTKDFTLKFDNIEYLDVEVKQYSSRKLQKGDLIIEKSGGSEKQPVGRAVVFDREEGNFSFSNFTSVLRIKDKSCLYYRYLYLYLLFSYSRGDTLKMQKATTGIHNIDFKEYLNMSVPVPPLSEQQAIVSRLDAAFAKIDAVKTNAEKQLNDAKTLFKKELSKAMTPKEGWERKKLGDIALDMYRGFGIRRDQVTEDGVPCVRYGEIYTTYNVSFDTCISHTKEEFISSPKYFENGDLLFAITGESVEDIGKTIAYLGNERCLLGGDIICMKHEQNPKFLAYALSTTDAIKQKGMGKTKLKVVHTNAPALKTISIPIPPLSVQQAIVSHLDTLSEKLKTVEEKQKAVMAECDAMKQALLREVFE